MDSVMMMYQCRFISCNKCTLSCGILIVGKGMQVWTGGIWKLSVLPTQFYYDPGTVLKVKVYLFLSLELPSEFSW